MQRVLRRRSLLTTYGANLGARLDFTPAFMRRGRRGSLPLRLLKLSQQLGCGLRGPALRELHAGGFVVTHSRLCEADCDREMALDAGLGSGDLLGGSLPLVS